MEHQNLRHKRCLTNTDVEHIIYIQYSMSVLTKDGGHHFYRQKCLLSEIFHHFH